MGVLLLIERTQWGTSPHLHFFMCRFFDNRRDNMQVNCGFCRGEFFLTNATPTVRDDDDVIHFCGKDCKSKWWAEMKGNNPEPVSGNGIPPPRKGQPRGPGW